VDEAVAVAEELYKRIVKASNEGRTITRADIIPGIYTIGARNKREDDCQSGEVAKSRVVHMPEFHNELHGGMFSDLITAHLVESGTGPIYIGNSFIKFDRFEKQLDNFHSAIEGDWKKYDSSLCNSLITMAVAILRLYFPPGILNDNHFLAILDSLVIKDYHVVGGKVLRILHGLPSGSKWTNLLCSVINLIVLNYIFSDIKYYDRSFAIGGDDFVTFIRKSEYDLDLIEERAMKLSSEIGMVFKIFKQKKYFNSKNVDDYPVFYKYTVFDGVPVVPIESLVERVLSPWNKKYKSNFEIIKFLDNVLPSLAHPTGACYIFYFYYKYVYYRMTKEEIDVNSLVERHYRLYRKMMDEGIDFYALKDFEFESKRNVYVRRIKISNYLNEVFGINRTD
jgi:hypothetical protein